MIDFKRRKSDCLKKSDKSSIGKFDKKIKNLCEKINSLENFYTLSSCSGRIVLIKNLEKKQPEMFVFRSHEKISFEELKKALSNYGSKENLIFKQESPIIHVACKTLEDAEKMLRKAQAAGMKHSGIISVAENRIVCEMIGSEQLALPVFSLGNILVDDNFLKILVRESNERLERGWTRIKKLEKILKNEC
jgi:tRNA wybutosine-synthesizing protein 3